MSIIKLELNEHEQEIMDKVMGQINETTTFLANLTREDRLKWLREYQYPHPISFDQEIDGTIYTVNAHFSNTADETVERKVHRILNRDIAH